MAPTSSAQRYGPFGPPAVKPHSACSLSLDGTRLLKVYRVVDPAARRDREQDALRLAAQWGFAVPRVLATGLDAGSAWAVLDVVPGAPGSFRTTEDIQAFIRSVHDTVGRLQQHSHDLTPGPGWSPSSAEAPVTNSAVLLNQLSARCRRQPWWSELEADLTALDTEPVTYLHGDLKPEHFLTGSEGLHIVDWEASARGPAQCDYADAVFHLVRDLLYTGNAPEHLPVTLISGLTAPGSVLAWRLLRWLDRRRPHDVALLAPHDFRRLVRAGTAAGTTRELARLITRLRAQRVPR